MNSERLSRRDFLTFVGALASIPAVNTIDRLNLSSDRVTFNDQGVMSVNGELFFPRVLYGLPGDPREFESWSLAKDAGFNTITMFQPTDNAFSYARELNLRSVVRLDYAFWGFEPNDEQVKRIEAEPSVIAWEIDEPAPGWPENNFTFLSWLKDRSKLPLRVTTFSGARLVSSLEGLAFLKRLYSSYPNVIAGPDVYNALPAEEIGRYDAYWEEQRALGNSDLKSLWQVTSAHTQDEVYFGRDLTYEDIFYQTISGIAAGSCGIGYYDSPWGCDLRSCAIDPESNGVINSFAQNFEHLRLINDYLINVESALIGTEICQGRRGNINFRIFRDAYDPSQYWRVRSSSVSQDASIEPL